MAILYLRLADVQYLSLSRMLSSNSLVCPRDLESDEFACLSIWYYSVATSRGQGFGTITQSTFKSTNPLLSSTCSHFETIKGSYCIWTAQLLSELISCMDTGTNVLCKEKCSVYVLYMYVSCVSMVMCTFLNHTWISISYLFHQLNISVATKIANTVCSHKELEQNKHCAFVYGICYGFNDVHY